MGGVIISGRFGVVRGAGVIISGVVRGAGVITSGLVRCLGVVRRVDKLGRVG